MNTSPRSVTLYLDLIRFFTKAFRIATLTGDGKEKVRISAE
ncbi:MAG: hypothetical protein ABIS50_01305 [Luteolibacter sp.]